jgi:hypothetical protein
MRARPRRPSSAWTRSRAFVLAVAGITLASAAWAAHGSLERMDRARDYYASLEPEEREQEIELALRFDHALWERIRETVEADDRFAVVSEAPEQHEVRNYANYELLPATQASTVEEATVVIYYASAPPPGSSCVPLGSNVCVERRSP